MTMLTLRDFETRSGQKKIIATIHKLEVEMRELDRLVHECKEKEESLERELDGHARRSFALPGL